MSPDSRRTDLQVGVLAFIAIAGTCASASAQTTATWQGTTNGSWFDAARWSSNPDVPNYDGVTTYRAVIDAAGATYSISLLQSIRLASLRLDSVNATVNHTAGIFDLDGTADLVRGVWRLNGGTIRGGTLAYSTTTNALRFANNANNTLDGVTISGSATFSDNFGRVVIRNGLSLSTSSSLAIAGNSFVTQFLGHQSISGGNVALGGPSYSAFLTVGDASTVAVAADAGVSGGGTISGVSGSSLNNAGTIAANISTKTLTLSIPTVTNSGTLEASNGGTLNVTGALSNLGLLRADGGTVNVSGVMTGSGQSQATNAGVIHLSGSISSQAMSGMQTSNGGLIRLSGTLTNTGAIYSVASGPDLELADATIMGGELAFGAGATVHGSGVTLDGVSTTGNATWTRSPINGLPFNLSLRGGSTLGASTRFTEMGEVIAMDPSSTLHGAITFDNQGAIKLGNTQVPSSVVLANGASVAIGGGQDFEIRSGSDVPDGDSTFVNRGSITGGGVGSSVWFRPGMFVNEGTVDLADGTDLRIGSAAGASNPMLDWSNSGTIRARNSTVRVSGGFTGSSLQGLDIAGSVATMSNAAIDNAGQVMTFGGSGTAWNLAEVAINGGTVNLVGSTPFQFSNVMATTTAISLNGATLNGDLNLHRSTLSGSSGSYILAVSNGLTLNGTIRGGLGEAIRAWGTQTWNGGTIELRKNLSSTSGSSTLTIGTENNEPNPTLTIGSSMTIKGGRALITGSANARLINNGRIVADTTGAEMTIMSHTNNGILEAVNGGALSLAGVENYGLIKVTSGGVLNLAGNVNFPVRFHPSTQWNRGAGTVNLIGVIDNAARTLTLDSTTGFIAGRGGRIIGGTVNIQTGGGFNLSNLTIGGGSSPLGLGLDGVTLNGDLYQPVSGGQIRLADSTVNGTITLRGGNGIILSRPNDDPTPVTLTGGTIVFDPQGSTQVKLFQPAGGHATLSPTTVIRGGGTGSGTSSTAQLGVNASLGATPTIINHGRISADVAGKFITIRPGTFRNEGIIEAINGGILEIGTSPDLQWSNTGTIRVGNGSQLWLNGSPTTAGLGTIESTGTGEIRLFGYLNNASSTLTLSSSTGSLYLDNTGKITGGTVVAPHGTPVRVVNTTLATFDGVSLVGDVAVGDAGRINILNSFSLSGNIRLEGSSASASFSGPRTLTTGTIAFSGTNGSERSIFPNSTLTLGPDFVVRGGFGRIFTSTSAAVVNNGLISADVAGQVLRIYQQQFTNNGTIQAINGGQIVFVPPGGFDELPTFTNSSSLAAGIMSALTFEGDYRQSELGLLRIDIGDTSETIESGWLSANAIALGGALQINTLSGTELVEGNSFRVLRAASISGQFDDLYLPAVSAPLRWETSRLYLDGTITVVPAPGAALCGLLIGGSLLRRRRS